jgi:pyruvoyl-dependent arginine decarboxylase (PvlArgDC)
MANLLRQTEMTAPQPPLSDAFEKWWIDPPGTTDETYIDKWAARACWQAAIEAYRTALVQRTGVIPPAYAAIDLDPDPEGMKSGEIVSVYSKAQLQKAIAAMQAKLEAANAENLLLEGQLFEYGAAAQEVVQEREQLRAEIEQHRQLQHLQRTQLVANSIEIDELRAKLAGYEAAGSCSKEKS